MTRRAVQIVGDKLDTIEINWMWLPTFVGQNKPLLDKLETALREEFLTPFEATEEALDKMHDFAVGFLCKQICICGFAEYLHAIKSVGEECPKGGVARCG